ncbi:type II secretion system F family protein [Novosphingobium sp.]|uniref:type II secretion system F family protein n=1 Tax=Novosphingobium sp. TaxID=1874826 RepID=UPI0038B74486
MARYAYQAVDPKGHERRGAIEAPGEAEAARRLAERRWHVLRLHRDLTIAADAATFPISLADRVRQRLTARTLSARQLALFTRQLASLITVCPIEEALRTIARQTERPATRSILLAVHAGVVEGMPLAEAMRLHRASFPPIYCAMIAAGEHSGSLPAIAERMAELLERQAQIRGRVLAALAYPVALALVALAVVVALMIWVVPRVVEQFDESGRQLPWLTRAVIGLSRFVGAWGWLLALGAVLAGAAFARGLHKPAFRQRVDAFVLRLPLAGRLIRDVHAAGLARTLAAMIEARLPLVDGLRLAARTVNNRVQAARLEAITRHIRAGAALSTAMREVSGFPPLLVYLAASGEAVGQFGPMLERAADYLDREFEAFSSTALALLEPAIIIVMGALVALIILSILLPILQLQTLTGF